MNRRFLLCALAFSVAALGGAVGGSSLSRAAEPPERVARVGFVYMGSPSSAMRGVTVFWERLRELGWVEGQNLVVETDYAEGRIDRLPALMATVVGHRVDVIVTSGTPAALAARAATRTIPIVVAGMGDPVGSGLAASLARPGGNLTGLSVQLSEGIPGKWLELLQEIVPRLTVVAVVGNPGNPVHGAMVTQLKAAAVARGIKLQFIDVRDTDALDRAFAKARQRAQAVLVAPDWLTIYHRRQIAALASRHRLPDMYGFFDVMEYGGLMGYGADLTPVWRRAADYVDKILRGAKPADLPIEQPTKWSLAVNLKRAKALGITIPESILIRADEVIR